MSDPLVSIVMAAHNEAQFIREAIDSMLHQTLQDFEFIIIDDGSTDSTSSLLVEYQDLDNRIHLKRFEENQGLTICLNIGLQLVKGKYIARMDADDVSLPHRLEEQVKFLDEHPEIDVLGTGFAMMDESGRRSKDYIFSRHPEILKWNLPFFTPIAHPSVMMRSSTVTRLGGYDPRLIRAQDYDLWWRVSLVGKISNLEEIHLLLRQHKGNISNKYQAQQEDFARRIGAKYLSIVLGRDILEGTIDNIKGLRTTARSAALAGEIILDYCGYCVQGAAVPVGLMIMRDALEKALRKIVRFVIYPVTWKVWSRIFLLFVRYIQLGSGQCFYKKLKIHDFVKK